MEFLVDIANYLWWYYVVPGIGATLATFFVEVWNFKVPIPRKAKLFAIAHFGWVILFNLWQWPTLAFLAASTYLRGDTLLMGALRKLHSNQDNILRKWEVLHTGVVVVHALVSYFPQERRVSHIILCTPGAVEIFRTMKNREALPVPFDGTELEDAKDLCTADKEWLDACAPERDFDQDRVYRNAVKQSRRDNRA